MRSQGPVLWQALITELPRLGTAGSRSAELHVDSALVTAVSGADVDQPAVRLRPKQLLHFAVLRWVGMVGSLLLAMGILGGGALPVVGNPYGAFPGATLLGQMPQASCAIAFVGIGALVVAWVCMAPLAGVRLRLHDAAEGTVRSGIVGVSVLWRTFAAWVAPIVITAPAFTQDIYSYLAQGAIVRAGMDVYSAGPIDLLGPENHLARSVPFIWAHSPSPYGPVALGVAQAISFITNDSIVLGVAAHRLVSVAAVACAGWAMSRLARRCGVHPTTAVWLGILNPLTILHLIAGIHNESLMLGLLLVGLELGLRGVEKLRKPSGWLLVGVSALLVSMAGMVKVTAFLALGFMGMELARKLPHAARGPWRHGWARLLTAIAVQVVGLVVAVAAVSAVTGISLGWISSQGGAATVRSWMSLSTETGVVFGGIGMLLGLGDHTDAMLVITRGAGLLVAGAFTVRLLFATLRGNIHPVGGLGVSTLVLVVLFPVVQPWYILWAILPLACWANRSIFRLGVVAYSAAFSFFVLPRGLSLPPATVLSIYVASAVAFTCCLALVWWLLRRWGFIRLD